MIPIGVQLSIFLFVIQIRHLRRLFLASQISGHINSLYININNDEPRRGWIWITKINSLTPTLKGLKNRILYRIPPVLFWIRNYLARVLGNCWETGRHRSINPSFQYSIHISFPKLLGIYSTYLYYTDVIYTKEILIKYSLNSGLWTGCFCYNYLHKIKKLTFGIQRKLNRWLNFFLVNSSLQ